MTSLATSSAPLLGILYMLLGGVFMTLNNAMLKWVSAYPPGQTLFLRGVFTVISILIILAFLRQRGSLRINSVGGHVVRAACMIVSTFCFILALRYLPLGETIAITFAGPLFLTAMAKPFLGEAVGWRRWMAVVVGFVGILVISRPTEETFRMAALLPLTAAFLAAVRDLVTRRITVSESSWAILMTTTIGLMAAGLCTLPFGWRMPTLLDALIMAGSGIFVTAGHFYFIDTFRHAEAGLVSPFKYLSIVWAAAIGFFVWGEAPDSWMLTGTTLVVGGGLYILHRELVRHRRVRHTPPTA